MDKKVIFNVALERKSILGKMEYEKKEGILLGVYKGSHEYADMRLAVLVGKNDIREVRPDDVIEIAVLTERKTK